MDKVSFTLLSLKTDAAGDRKLMTAVGEGARKRRRLQSAFAVFPHVCGETEENKNRNPASRTAVDVQRGKDDPYQSFQNSLPLL